MDERFDSKEQEQEWGVPSGPPPEIRLPFGAKRRKEAGEWIYDNRGTICISVIIYLITAIVLLSAQIALQPRAAEAQLVIDFSSDVEELQRLERELERAQAINDMLSAGGYANVANAVSNENAVEEMSAETREIFEQSDEVMRDMADNGAEYEQMLAMLDSKSRVSTEEKKVVDARIEGNVTVSFSLAAPLRHAVRLPVPAYKCAGGGTVVVEIDVDRNGGVLSAAVDKGRSSGDECMVTAALEMALRSRFNVDSSAPRRQTGSITYVFVPQYAAL